MRLLEKLFELLSVIRSLYLYEQNEQIKIRLEGIDGPESKQDFGQKAKQAAADLCFNKFVRVEQSGTVRYGRVLGWVYVGDVCVNKELVRMGLAWHYKQYNKDPELAKLENEAKAKNLGLWSTGNEIPPWEWRLQ